LQTQKLGDLSISRPKSRLSWGIELPFDKAYVTYVWFDALVNYMSALEYLPREKPVGERFWPADVHLVGKDILTTHAVYWSTMLMALNLPLPDTIFAHGWWTVDGEKMSKSRRNVVDPNKMIDEFGADAFRYFLLRGVPFGQDGDFSQSAMIATINGDLANGLGNLLSRTLKMIHNFTEGKIPERKNPTYEWMEETIKSEIEARPLVMNQHYSTFRFKDDLEGIKWIITLCDQLIDEFQPWKLAKKEDGKAQLHNILNTLSRALRALSISLYPYMPKMADELLRQLGITLDWSQYELDEKTIWRAAIEGSVVKTGSPLFPRIETKTGAKPVTESSVPSQPTPAAPAPTAAPAPPAVPQITIDEFMKIQLKTAKVLSAERVPKSEKLIKLQVSLGTEQRQIVAGIGKKYEPDALVGRTIVIVTNLKPAKLMGIESQGMVLAAGDADVRGLLTVLEEVDPGTKVK
jgi:methionyl-tRNA synthetase